MKRLTFSGPVDLFLVQNIKKQYRFSWYVHSLSLVLCTCRSILGRKGRGRGRFQHPFLFLDHLLKVLWHIIPWIWTRVRCYQPGDRGAAGPELGARQSLLCQVSPLPAGGQVSLNLKTENTKVSSFVFPFHLWMLGWILFFRKVQDSWSERKEKRKKRDELVWITFSDDGCIILSFNVTSKLTKW